MKTKKKSAIYIKRLSLLSAMICLFNCTSQSLVKDEKFNDYINKTLKENSLPSLSIAVSRKNKTIFTSAYGYADLEHKVKATTESVYRIGSVSKTITSALIMILNEKGKLDIEAPIQNYCTLFPNKRGVVNSKLLMSHQAGIRNYASVEEFYSSKRYKSSSDAISIFKEDPLIANPGTKYSYSSYGYSILGCAIEHVLDNSFEIALEDYIFKIANMKNTEMDYSETIILNRVNGYEKLGDGTHKNSPYVDLSNKFPGGGILSTPTDLVKFGNALLNNKLVNKKSLQEMWKPQNTINGKSTNYAFGWRISDDQREIYHGGSSAGGTAYIYIKPEEELVIAFTANLSSWSQSRHEFAQQLAEFFKKDEN